jgi:hypothetical protein
MKKIIIIASATIILLALPAIWIYASSSKRLSPQEHTLLTQDWLKVTHNNWSPWITLPNGTKEWNPAASFNQWVETIPEKDKAWPTIARTLIELEELKTHEYLGTPPHKTKYWFELFDLCYRHQDTIDQLAAAMHAPHVGAPISSGTDPITHQLLIDQGYKDPDWDPNPPRNMDLWINPTHITSTFRRTNQILSTAAYAALDPVEDTDRFLFIIDSMLAGTHLSLNRSTLIDFLSYTGTYINTLDVIEWALVHHPNLLDDQDFVQLDQMLETYPFKPLDATGEILVLHDRYRRLQPQLGNIDADRLADIPKSWIPDTQHPPSNKPITKLDPRLQHLLIYISRQHIKVANKSTLPWDGTELSINDFKEGLNRVPAGIQPDAEAHRYIMTLWSQSLLRQVRTHAIRLAIAMERHHRRHNHYPETLDQLDEDLITTDINDPFTNKPLLYLLSDTGPVIYSAGTDRDDDNATPLRDLYINPNHESLGNAWNTTYGGIRYSPHWISKLQANEVPIQPQINGDWVLYPTPQQPDSQHDEQ